MVTRPARPCNNAVAANLTPLTPLQPHVLILPGWQNSGAAHWQSRWEALHGYTRVQQHDWDRPLRGDWIARLEDEVLAHCKASKMLSNSELSAPKNIGQNATFPYKNKVVLVAHSLGCIQVAAWAALSRNTYVVHAALLVAPGDVERADVRPLLPSWAPIVRTPLPFRSLLVGSRNDPFCSLARAQQLAHDWGSRFVDYGERGHINADSALGDWGEGHAWLHDLARA
jgi:uncharacterized protein